MSDTRTALATDVDAAWFAWTGADRRVRVGDFSAFEPVITQLDEVEADGVLGGALPGTFLFVDGDRALRWDVRRRRRLGEAFLPPGTQHLLDLNASGSADYRFTLVAATDTELYGLCVDGWSRITTLDGPALVLAWQHRRRSVLLLTEGGTLSRIDPVHGDVLETAEAALPGADGPSCYDEVLGGVWTTFQGTSTARFARVEPWPPVIVYSIELPTTVEGLSCSHSGEWLIVRGREVGDVWLYNVNGRRSFVPPPAVAERSLPAAFSYTNFLVAVDGDDTEVTEIPARADIRAPGAQLDIDTFWESAPRMHRAVRPGGG